MKMSVVNCSVIMSVHGRRIDIEPERTKKSTGVKPGIAGVEHGRGVEASGSE